MAELYPKNVPGRLDTARWESRNLKEEALKILKSLKGAPRSPGCAPASAMRIRAIAQVSSRISVILPTASAM